LQRDLPMIVSNPRSGDVIGELRAWCGKGQTVALVGSSGAGKSTMINALVGPAPGEVQQNGSISEHDSQGRHKTTSRSLPANNLTAALRQLQPLLPFPSPCRKRHG
jgi:ribosome biogenesis GTPase